LCCLLRFFSFSSRPKKSQPAIRGKCHSFLFAFLLGCQHTTSTWFRHRSGFVVHPYGSVYLVRSHHHRLTPLRSGSRATGWCPADRADPSTQSPAVAPLTYAPPPRSLSFCCPNDPRPPDISRPKPGRDSRLARHIGSTSRGPAGSLAW